MGFEFGVFCVLPVEGFVEFEFEVLLALLAGGFVEFGLFWVLLLAGGFVEFGVFWVLLAGGFVEFEFGVLLVGVEFPVGFESETLVTFLPFTGSFRGLFELKSFIACCLATSPAFLASSGVLPSLMACCSAAFAAFSAYSFAVSVMVPSALIVPPKASG